MGMRAGGEHVRVVSDGVSVLSQEIDNSSWEYWWKYWKSILSVSYMEKPKGRTFHTYYCPDSFISYLSFWLCAFLLRLFSSWKEWEKLPAWDFFWKGILTSHDFMGNPSPKETHRFQGCQVGRHSVTNKDRPMLFSVKWLVNMHSFVRLVTHYSQSLLW